MKTSKDFNSLTEYARYVAAQAQANTERLQAIKAKQQVIFDASKIRLQLAEARARLNAARNKAHARRIQIAQQWSV